MAEAPRIVIGRRAIAGAIVIDHGRLCFWRDGKRSITGNRGGQIKFRLVAALLLRRNSLIPWAELIDHLYGDDPEGGPMNPRNTISALLAQNRALIAWLGIRASPMHGRGQWVEAVAAPAAALQRAA